MALNASTTTGMLSPYQAAHNAQMGERQRERERESWRERGEVVYAMFEYLLRTKSTRLALDSS